MSKLQNEQFSNCRYQWIDGLQTNVNAVYSSYIFNFPLIFFKCWSHTRVLFEKKISDFLTPQHIASCYCCHKQSGFIQLNCCLINKRLEDLNCGAFFLRLRTYSTNACWLAGKVKQKMEIIKTSTSERSPFECFSFQFRLFAKCC